MKDALHRAAEAPPRAGEAALDVAGRRLLSALPPDAVGRLSRSCGPAGHAGGRRAEEWVLRFEPRRRGRIDPLMGWWGGGDPLPSVTLRFPTRQAAEEYAARHGLALEVCEPPRVLNDPCRRAALAQAQGLPADPTLPWIWDGRGDPVPPNLAEPRREVAGAPAGWTARRAA
ncbi:MAG TPA: NADH dehydrogenase ubiquinone Fe-S protein 4 [Acetobacteraceae bacterium]|nr:NADH dehydrogenase ubiquinone Fe-S protein 4 [Acetobacteraceae bacterium]